MRKPQLTRRMLLGTMAAGSAAAMAHVASAAPAADDASWKINRGRINQSVVHWCFKPMPVEDLARSAAALGIKSVELVPPSDWPILKKHGLTCAIAGSHGFVKGWNDKANWD
jgi:hydroxypyruvate isomerase